MERKTIAQIKNEFDLACEDMIEMIQNYQESLKVQKMKNLKFIVKMKLKKFLKTLKMQNM